MTNMRRLMSEFGWGIALAGGVAALAIWAAALPGVSQWGLSALTIAILIGIAVGNTFFARMAPACGKGIDFSRTRLLRLGIVLYGFRITFQQIGEIGWAGVAIAVSIIGLTFLLAVQLGTRLFKLDRQTAMLIGAGSAICGAAAVVAAEPIVKGQAHKVTVAVATVVIFGTIAMFVYPLLYPHLQLSEAGYGLYVGSTVHEVAQVVVAGKAVSDQAASTAVIEKMLRVMLLAPFLLILSKSIKHEDQPAGSGKRIMIPWFAVLFIAASGIHSLHLLPAAAVDFIVDIDTALLAMAMAALGVRTHAGALRQAGLKPLLLAGMLFAFLLIGGYLLNRAAAMLF